MIQPEFRKELEKQQTVLMLVWAAFLVATGFYVALAHLLIQGGDSFQKSPLAETVRQVLWLVVLVEIAFLFWWQKRFLTKEAILHKSGKSRWIPRLVKGQKNPLEERAGTIISCYLVEKVVTFAVAESLAIYGLYLVYIGRYFWDQYVLSAMCVFLLLSLYPKKALMVELLREADLP